MDTHYHQRTNHWQLVFLLLQSYDWLQTTSKWRHRVFQITITYRLNIDRMEILPIHEHIFILWRYQYGYMRTINTPYNQGKARSFIKPFLVYQLLSLVWKYNLFCGIVTCCICYRTDTSGDWWLRYSMWRCNHSLEGTSSQEL